MAEKTTSQCANILKHLEKHPDGLTAFDALTYFGCMRLAARISDLRAKGYIIEAVSGRYGVRFVLVRPEDAAKEISEVLGIEPYSE